MQARLDKLQGGTVKLDVRDKERVEKRLLDARTAWKRRKRLFTDAWATISEALPGKPKELLEEMGVETDEKALVDWNRDPTAGLLDAS